ncbi:uncharacterized protein TRIVIDRAFT_225784 [Trichoderma virens Gv29-8]|uniref:Uncharacterized protein n=1 Tax=Hypocrea virens (strain Gv29-8 / FGSC 10586) TaxID=413071 RepID=G9N4F3_HYPVG|nr:uncharacterized protein TRIVIDRAFT_225784 [Trichoderma virens Gv29-8]EHK18478.1 hypothetical protein TRIVIDRAFT_225784 [Trichoderma virens Gv29-8]UKZ52687.1 hypothetical protein TrVGV298_006468 [Trichoderma virens]
MPQAAKSVAKRILDMWDEKGTKRTANIDLGSDSCFVSYPSPCMHCAFGLAEGDPRYLCRIDSFDNDGDCIECILAQKKCTWLGFYPSTEECLNLLYQRKVACLSLQRNGRSKITLAALDVMIQYALKYLVDMWNNAHLGELYSPDCCHDDLPDSTQQNKNKNKNGKKNKENKEVMPTGSSYKASAAKASAAKASAAKAAETKVSSSGDISSKIPHTP